MKAALLIFAVIACPLFWTMIVVPLIANVVGVPIKVGVLPIARRNHRLGRRQSFWFGGVLGWGVGLSLFCALWVGFIEHKRLTFLAFLFSFVLCSMVAGGAASSADLTYSVNEEPQAGS